MTDLKHTNWYQEFYDSSILLAYRGSITHGTFRPSTDPNSIDDKDIMGVIVSPVEHYLGFGRQDTYERIEGEWDVVTYEAKKFVHLLTKSNPNVLSLLWTPERYFLKVTDSGRKLIENRNLFVSKEAYQSFQGYAYSQLKKMEHNELLLKIEKEIKRRCILTV